MTVIRYPTQVATYTSITAQSAAVNGLLTVTRTALSTTPTSGVLVQNTTAATSGAPIQYSPDVVLSGTGHDTDGDVSVTCKYALEVRPVNGNTVTAGLHWLADVGAGSYTSAMNLTYTTLATLTLTGAAVIKSTTSLDLQFTSTSRIKIDTTGIGVFAHATAAQSADIGAISTLTDSPASADALRDDINTNWMPWFASLRTHLRAHGWMA